MTDEQMNIYKMRITQASTGELTVIMLEMEIQWMDEALEAYEAGNMEEFIQCVSRAQGVQVELMTVLNMDNAVAVDVYSVFAFINKQLIHVKLKRVPLDIKRCRDILEKYRQSFEAIAKTDTAGPVMAGSEKVYAGLTYGAGGLVESSMGGTEYTV